MNRIISRLPEENVNIHKILLILSNFALYKNESIHLSFLGIQSIY